MPGHCACAMPGMGRSADTNAAKHTAPRAPLEMRIFQRRILRATIDSEMADSSNIFPLTRRTPDPPGASIARIVGLLVLRPVLGLAGEIGPLLMREILRHVDRLLVGQATLPQRELLVEPDRHVALDECRCGIGARHAGTDVERSISPQRRVDHGTVRLYQALAVLAVAHRALLGVDLPAVFGVGLDGHVDLADAAADDLVDRRGLALHPVEVR